MAVDATAIAGLLVIRWPCHEDERGFFRQVWQRTELDRALGRAFEVAQTNHARSTARVLRGLHAEPWDKLVTVTHGTAFIAVADIRPGSTTFGCAQTFILGDRPGTPAAVFVSDGLAHGYAVGPDASADVVYSVSEPWRDVDKRAIAWNDPDLAIDWPVGDPILSPADMRNPTLRERFPGHPQFTK